MKIKIIQVGKNKDEFVEGGVGKFLKLLRPFAEIEVVTLKEISPSKTFAAEKCVQEEGEQILKSLTNNDDFLMVLDEGGRQLKSTEFAEVIKKHKDLGQKVTFVIGGPFGLSDQVKSQGDLVLSLSSMTFTHQMIRIFLLEQIYRSFSIIQGKEYHHE